jgi:LuxR family transcriptional regulator of csgAB operon
MDYDNIALIGKHDSLGANVETILTTVYGYDRIKSLSISDHSTVENLHSYDIVLLIYHSSFEKRVGLLQDLADKSKLMFIYENRDFKLIQHMVRIGARGIIQNDSINELANGVKEVKSGGFFICQESLEILMGNVGTRKKAAELSDREIEILNLISRGSTYMEISDDLFISFDTTKSHVYNIYKKLKAKNKSEAVYKARKQRILI